MTTPLDTFIASGGTSGAPTAPNSRYYGLGTQTWTRPDGVVLRYIGRRLVPQPGQSTTARQYVVKESDRIDNLASTLIGDPLLYWLICDANAAIDPDDLTAQIGRTIVITLPSGIGGQGNSA
jgi:hypothetical protein